MEIGEENISVKDQKPQNEKSVENTTGRKRDW